MKTATEAIVALSNCDEFDIRTFKRGDRRDVVVSAKHNGKKGCFVVKNDWNGAVNAIDEQLPSLAEQLLGTGKADQ